MHAHAHVHTHTRTHTHTTPHAHTYPTHTHTYSTPTCTSPLECYQEEPTGEVEMEVEVTVPEVDFVASEDVFPTPPPVVLEPSSSPNKRGEPSRYETPETPKCLPVSHQHGRKALMLLSMLLLSHSHAHPLTPPHFSNLHTIPHSNSICPFFIPQAPYTHSIHHFQTPCALPSLLQTTSIACSHSLSPVLGFQGGGAAGETD